MALPIHQPAYTHAISIAKASVVKAFVIPMFGDLMEDTKVYLLPVLEASFSALQSLSKLSVYRYSDSEKMPFIAIA